MNHKWFEPIRICISSEAMSVISSLPKRHCTKRELAKPRPEPFCIGAHLRQGVPGGLRKGFHYGGIIGAQLVELAATYLLQPLRIVKQSPPDCYQIEILSRQSLEQIVDRLCL